MLAAINDPFTLQIVIAVLYVLGGITFFLTLYVASDDPFTTRDWKNWLLMIVLSFIWVIMTPIALLWGLIDSLRK